VGQSDPYCELFIKTEKQTEWQSLGQSEVIYNNLNPDFVKVFKANYYFEKNQIIKAEIYDHDDDEPDLIGFYEIPLNKLLTCPKQTMRDQLMFNHPDGSPSKGKSRGRIIIRADSVTDSNYEMTVNVTAMLVSKRRTKLTFGCFHGYPNNPYLTVERALSDDDSFGQTEWMKVYQSPVQYDTIEPEFPQVTIKLQRLCDGNKTLPIRWTVWSQVGDGRKMYGESVQSLNDIDRQGDKQIKIKNQQNKTGGYIMFDSFKVVQKPSFVEYLKSGWYINLAVGIDFTASNEMRHQVSYEPGVKN
jgi:hypothetical protein